MKCEEFKKGMTAYCDGELNSEEMIKFKEHLSACPDCNKEILSLDKCATIMRTIYEEKKPPDSIKAALEKCCGFELPDPDCDCK